MVNGPLNSLSAMDEYGRPVTSANHISVAHLEELLVKQYKHDFPEEECQMSIEDRKCMNIASNSVTLKDGHYHLPLPLRDRNITLPNNYPMAKQRALNLKRKFKKDQVYATEYKDFMNDIPSEEVQQENGRVWYIPHHGVYHKRKKTSLWFLTASSYKGMSLNSELLQGPDLTNSLIGVLLRFHQEQVALMADIEGIFHQVQVSGE